MSPTTPYTDAISNALAVNNAKSVKDYLDRFPNLSLVQLAEAMGGVAPIEIEWTLIDEGHQRGTLRDHMRELLYRYILNASAGWPKEKSWEAQSDLRRALIGWQCSLGDPQYEKRMDAIVTDLLSTADIPPGWRPSNATDPELARVFDAHWPPLAAKAGNAP